MAAKSKRINLVRYGVQIFFFVLVALLTLNHSLNETQQAIPFLSQASVHAICPFGGVVSIYQLISQGSYVQKTHSASFILMFIVFALTILVGPAFCGWVCPLGAIQEWFGKIGKMIFKRKYNRLLPAKLDSMLRYLRYAMLAYVVIMTALTAKLIFNEIDPYAALFHLWSSDLAIGGLVILISTLALSLFVERPFCKYACPYGALLGIFNLLRVFKIKRNAATCIDCKKCDRICPMNIVISDKPRVLNHQCISCLQCTSEQACPVEKTLELMTGKMEKEAKNEA